MKESLYDIQEEAECMRRELRERGGSSLDWFMLEKGISDRITALLGTQFKREEPTAFMSAAGVTTSPRK